MTISCKTQGKDDGCDISLDKKRIKLHKKTPNDCPRFLQENGEVQNINEAKSIIAQKKPSLKGFYEDTQILILILYIHGVSR